MNKFLLCLVSLSCSFSFLSIAFAESNFYSKGTHIVVDLKENILKLYEGKKLQREFPVVTGKDSTKTPAGVFSISYKERCHPFRDKSTREILYEGCAKGNPFGSVFMPLQGGDGVAIHGTSSPDLVMKHAKVSHGCIRMLNRDAEELYGRVSEGTLVRTVQGSEKDSENMGDQDEKGGSKTKDNEGSKAKDNEGNKAKDNEGSKTKDNEGSKAKDNEGSKAKDNEGSKAKDNEGSKTKDNEGSKAKDNEGSKAKDDGGGKAKDNGDDEGGNK
ncbi:L,D-transpeptidase [Pasteuria penetrans]|uniref:L,D-transpeptidase n=1 Tax=Pasteuria penetrans TaxID=86005 RepID=UPI000FA8E3E3|nr:L,D-transpeptidase [Pasteuria penetrans]